ncbi:thiamine pyrophosphate-dependent enzyme [Desulfobacula phenolica]|uniref:Pyruvate ferredoxin oxidoreductase beta subunit n=1 Tax=Desulfobacula phenolica TaxID=90732 RepID=A0A1H2JGK2_9BACT|nr:thiamine pyrophosphate-dependent enzyme [Desulfobacula phenolica]SDU55215.1 pyruvate ferredoxin oxidoreductase beta subunit [Desulfobacula phenolica]
MKQGFVHGELMMPGHLACQGCGGTLVMKHALEAIGPNMVLVIPACCWTVIPGNFPSSALNVAVLHTAAATSGAAASGIRAALDVKGMHDTKILVFAGNGETFDNGLQSLSGAAERNDDIIYICYDTGACMNTVVQRSLATCQNVCETKSSLSQPKSKNKKNMIRIMSGHKIPYCATANIAFPDDLYRKVKNAADIKGTCFIHVLSACPSGWKIPPEKAVEISRLATCSKAFPLYEVFNGEEYRITMEPDEVLVEDYLQQQGRFRHLKEEDLDIIQERVDYEWKILLQRSMIEPFRINF